MPDPTSPAHIEKLRELICEAISKRKSIRFRYKDDPSERIAEPFCCGKSFKGTYILRCFQIRGPSDSHKLGWKLVDLADMSELEITDKDYSGIRPGYNPRNKDIKEVFCCRGRSPS